MLSWLKVIIFLIFVLDVILIAALLAVSYPTTLYVLLGVVVALLLAFIVPYILKLERRWLIIIGISIISLLCVGTFLISVAPRSYTLCTPGEKREIELTQYQAVIKPTSFPSDSFSISEKVTYDEKSVVCKEDRTVSESVIQKGVVFSLPERQIASTARGVLIREVRAVPLVNAPLGIPGCCPKTQTIELRDFPRDSFYEAYDAQKIESSQYLDTEIIRWQYKYLGSEITFAYLVPPFHLFRTLLIPLIQVSFQNQWGIALLSLVASVIVTKIGIPLIIESTKNRLKPLIGKDSGEEKPQKATLIVSGKGDEKEIELRKKSK